MRCIVATWRPRITRRAAVWLENFPGNGRPCQPETMEGRALPAGHGGWQPAYFDGWVTERTISISWDGPAGSASPDMYPEGCGAKIDCAACNKTAFFV